MIYTLHKETELQRILPIHLTLNYSDTKPAYLTIDDGPSPHRIEKLSVLKAHAIPAVFFSEGKSLEEKPELGLQTIQDGFILGNHGFGHRHFSALSLEEGCREILRTDEIIHALYLQSGQQDHPRFFRFPYGDKGDGKYGLVFNKWKKRDTARHRYLQDFLRELGYSQPDFPDITHPFYRKAGLLGDVDWHWTFDVMEWAVFQSKPTLGISSMKKVNTRMKSNRPSDCRGELFWQKRWLGNPRSGEIILMHDHVETGDVFSALIAALLRLPLRFLPF